MKVIVLGTGDAFTTSRNNTAFVVEHNGKYVAVDCPHPYLKILKENNIDPIKIDDIIITHLHGDHIGGLDTFLFYRKFVLGQRTNIHGLSFIEELWDGHLKSSMGKSFDKDMRYDEFYNAIHYETACSSGPIKFEMRETKHYIPATAIRFGIMGESGWKLGFSGDTAFDIDLIEWLNEAEVIFHEFGPPPGHTPIEKFLLLSAEIRMKMRYIHYSDDVGSTKNLKDGEVIQL